MLFITTNPHARAPLIKSIIFLREQNGTRPHGCRRQGDTGSLSQIARRKVKLVALVINKLCNTVNIPFRSRAKGLNKVLFGLRHLSRKLIKTIAPPFFDYAAHDKCYINMNSLFAKNEHSFYYDR